MPDWTRNSLEDFSETAMVAFTAFMAAFMGTLFGIAVVRRLSGTGSGDNAEGVERSELVSWTRLSRLEEELDSSRAELAAMKRDYELDTGLLKQEIRRLELLLGRFASGRAVEAPVETEGTGSAGPGYHPLKLIDPLRSPGEGIIFSTLATFEGSDRESAVSDRP